MTPVTQLLEAANKGDHQAAADLLPLVYNELRRLAGAKLANERPGHSLNATGLVHEAYLKLVGDRHFEGRGHFFAAVAEAMRRILIDQARTRIALKNGGGAIREEVDPDQFTARSPDEEMLTLDEALADFVHSYPTQAALVKLRYFGGLSADEAAIALGISPSTGDRHWAFARAWLRRKMND